MLATLLYRMFHSTRSPWVVVALSSAFEGGSHCPHRWLGGGACASCCEPGLQLPHPAALPASPRAGLPPLPLAASATPRCPSSRVPAGRACSCGSGCTGAQPLAGGLRWPPWWHCDQLRPRPPRLVVLLPLQACVVSLCCLPVPPTPQQ